MSVTTVQVLEVDGVVVRPAVETIHEADLSPEEREAAQQIVAFQAAWETASCRMRWRPKAKEVRS